MLPQGAGAPFAFKGSMIHPVVQFICQLFESPTEQNYTASFATDYHTDMLPQGAGAPFAFNDSPTRAILTTFRSYHVTSSIHEPRDLQPKVAFHFPTYRHS